MEAALCVLKEAGEREFLRSTRTALRIVQNAAGGEEKYLRVRAASKVNRGSRCLFELDGTNGEPDCPNYIQLCALGTPYVLIVVALLRHC